MIPFYQIWMKSIKKIREDISSDNSELKMANRGSYTGRNVFIFDWIQGTNVWYLFIKFGWNLSKNDEIGKDTSSDNSELKTANRGSYIGRNIFIFDWTQGTGV